MTDLAFVSRKMGLPSDRSILEFQIDNTYEIPLALMTSHISQFQTVLTFAAKLLETEKSVKDEFTRDHLFSQYMKEIQAKHSQEMVSFEKKAISESASMISPLLQRVSDIEKTSQSTLDETRREYEQQIKALQKTNKILESELSSIKSDTEAISQRDMKQLQKKIAELEIDLARSSKSESIIREQCQAESDRLVAALKESTKDLMKVKDDSLKQREDALRSKEDELTVKLQRQASSSFRGQDGEQYFSQTAKEKMKWDLTHTGKVAHSGDYASTIHTNQVLFELKNYTTTVPQKEVRKFHNDMKDNPDFVVGVFISLNTDIQSHPWSNSPIAIDWINGSQCAIYIQSCLELDIDHTLYTIDQIIRIAGEFHKRSFIKDDESKAADYEQRAERAKRLLENGILSMSSLIRKIRADHKKYMDLLEGNTNHTILELKGQTEILKTTIQTLLSDYVDTTIQEDEIVEQKPVKSPRKSKGTIKN
jgi:hypothetical protein